MKCLNGIYEGSSYESICWLIRISLKSQCWMDMLVNSKQSGSKCFNSKQSFMQVGHYTCEILDWAILDGSFYCMPFTLICVHEYSGLGPVLLSCFLTWAMGFVVGHEDTESLLYVSCNPAHLCVPWPHPCHTPCSCIGGGMCSPKLPCTPLAEVLAMFLSYLNIMLIFH